MNFTHHCQGTLLFIVNYSILKITMTNQLRCKKLGLVELLPEEASIFEESIAEADIEHSTSSSTIGAPLPLWRPPSRPSYERIKCNDFTFVFKYDENNPEILHIYSRHLTTSDDAINLFFSQDASWDEKRNRFVNYSETHGLYWFWRNEEKKIVMVVSCFKL